MVALLADSIQRVLIQLQRAAQALAGITAEDQLKALIAYLQATVEAVRGYRTTDRSSSSVSVSSSLSIEEVAQVAISHTARSKIGLLPHASGPCLDITTVVGGRVGGLGLETRPARSQ